MNFVLIAISFVFHLFQAFARKDVAMQVFTLGCRSNVTVTAPMYKAVSYIIIII